MAKNNTAIKAVAIVLGLLATACGSHSSPTGPTTGASSLAVTVNGNIAGQIAPISSTSGIVATVQISSPASNSAIKPVAVDAMGVAQFNNLADGTYTVAATTDGGYQGNQTQVTVSGNVATSITLKATYALKLLAVIANGVPVKSGDKVTVPTNLQFQVQMMNTGENPSIIVTPLVRAGSTTVGFVYDSAPVPVGSQTVTLGIPNFQPCVSAHDGLNYNQPCFSQANSIVFSVSTAGGAGGLVVLQNTANFIMNF